MRKTKSPSTSMPEAPTKSIIHDVEPFDEDAVETVHIVEVDRRLALMGRFVLEAALRSKGQMSLKDKADIAIRTINVVEGAKQRVELWARDATRDIPQTVEQYERERQESEGRLRSLLERRDALGKRRAATEVLEVLESTEVGEN